MLIQIAHPELNQQKTKLSADLAAQAVSSTVDNNDGFAANKYVVFGKPGQEKTEIVLLSSVSDVDTLGHTTPPVFSHIARTQVSLIRFNKIEIYRATSQGGSYSLIATIDIDIDEEVTVYDDTDGTTSSWYKTRFKNVYDTTYSDYSDEVQGTGYTEDSLWSMQEEILEEFGDPNADEISRTRVRTLLKSGVRALTMRIAKVVRDYRRKRTTGQMVAGSLTDLPTRFLKLYALNLNYSGNVLADSYKVENFEDEHLGFKDDLYSNSDPAAFFRDNQFGVRPDGSPYYWMWYLDYPADMVDPADEHGHPHGARECLVAYVLWKLWRPKNLDKSSAYKSDYKDLSSEYIDFVAQSRQSISPMRVKTNFGDELYE